MSQGPAGCRVPRHTPGTRPGARASSTGEFAAELVTRVVQGLVERTAGGPEPLGQDIDRHAVERKRELVRPGREATLTAKVIESGEHRDHRIVCCLIGDVVEIAAANVRQHAPAAGDLEPRRAQQYGVQACDQPKVGRSFARASSGSASNMLRQPGQQK